MVLVAVLLVAAGLGSWAWLSHSTQPNPASGNAEADRAARDILIRCASDEDCQIKQLHALVQAQSPAVALFALDDMAARNKEVEQNTHVLAHEIGYATYDKFKTLPERLSACRDNAASGCFHGVMMKTIGAEGVPSRQVVATACDEVKKTQTLYFQCLHGLGHGVMMGHILTAKGTPGIDAIRGSLADCDATATSYEQQSCYAGAFMEYLVAASYQIFHYPVQPKYKPSDLHWPCDAIQTKYVQACYQFQGRYILDAKKWDFPAAFKECDRAPDAGKYECASNIGRDILGTPDRAHFAYVIEHCDQTVNDFQRGACITGAARYIMNYNADVGMALDFCVQAKGAGDRQCVDAVRSDARFFGWDEEKIQQAVSTAGADRL